MRGSGTGRVTGARVDHDECAGVAMCVQAAGTAFALDDAGQAVFVPEGDWTETAVELAADSCPMSAIAVIREWDGAR